MQKSTHRIDVIDHTRSVFKSISWRIVATLTTMTIVYLFTKKIFLSIGIGAVEVVAKILFYYIHERIWNKIKWGKKDHPLSDIPVNRKLEPKDREIIVKKLKDLGYID
jgi:adenylylsulfate kinase